MGDNEEPQSTQIANVQVANSGHKLPEQSRVPRCDIPRAFGFDHLIHQWQPMGIRVVLNLPFTGNDQDFIFAIRNGPFIPRLFYQYTDSDGATEFKKDAPTVLDPTKRKVTATRNYESYAINNMRNVIHAGKQYSSIVADESAITITQFDQPPILSSLSTMFRRWRGTMHYRVRTVAGFTTQGYIFSTLVRNSPGIIGVYPTQSQVAGVLREDASYREAMINSYIMGDTAMFRHFEVQVPFEYPVPYYDQYNWIGNRSRPADKFMWANDSKDVQQAETIRFIRNEPHGDNFLLIGLRGKLDSSVQNSQVTFELEYRAGDDFQFSDPFLPYNNHYLVPQATFVKLPMSILTVPSKDYTTDGLGGFVRSKSREVENNKTSHIVSSVPNNLRPVRRLPRSVDDEEGYDEVDDLKSEIGDPPELLEFKRNMRKSLRNF